jgi:3-oxoacyl-[acyl-carrier protein] reductase
MDLELEGRVAIVTGGRTGIGASVAANLANKGANVVICSRGLSSKWDEYDKIMHENGKIYSLCADATSPTEVKHIVESTISNLDHLDILVNNVGGVKRFAGFFELTDDEWRETFELNVMSMIHFIRYSYTYLKQSPSARIITISSLTGVQPGFYNPHYSIAKASTLNLNKHLANLFAKDKILVNVVCPGPVHSNSWDKNVSRIADIRNIPLEEARIQVETEESKKVPLGKIGEGSDVAELVAFLASDRASWITGSCFIIDGGKHCSIF